MGMKKPRGVHDILPGEVERWQHLEGVIRELTRVYGYREIRTPVFEFTELFQRGVGEETDIVAKEMYSFPDRRGRSLSLRPEGTAPVVRAFIENNLHTWPQPVKLYYTGPMFRYDRPQAWRYRQFHQFGVEVFGSADPAVDAEVIALLMEFYERIGLKELTLEINSVGCAECRADLTGALRNYFTSRLKELCRDCRARLGRNPLRLLDCKEEKCRGLAREAPVPLQFLCSRCEAHFQAVLKELETLNIGYAINPCLVRGLDYYTGTAFEVTVLDAGAQNALGGGGRYDNLVETCGGRPTPGVGFAVGLERTLYALEQQGVKLPGAASLEAFVATAGEVAAAKLSGVLRLLREAGIAADRDYTGRGLKGQLKQAHRRSARWVVILGDEELSRGNMAVRDMDTGEQAELPETELVRWLRTRQSKTDVLVKDY
ncbi:MAG TPA: histidine--tRNA ligase [Desulfotomaculum sp.]|nr:histidine--tRNA ligase [Desulfotomaculum sp.]